MRRFIPMLTGAALIALAPTPAEAKGCIRGAMVGAVAGHYAGHHAAAGAVGGCIAARAYYRHKAKQDAQARAHHPQMAPAHR